MMAWSNASIYNMSTNKVQEKNDIFPSALGLSVLPRSLKPVRGIVSTENSDSSESSESDSDNDDVNVSTPSQDSSIDGTPITLPQRPDVALTRDVHWFCPRDTLPMRQSTQPKHVPPSHLTLITNHGLTLASRGRPNEHRPSVSFSPRSEHRAAAAQRMFYALAHSSRRDRGIHQRQQQQHEGLSTTNGSSRPRVSMLQGLSAQARRRHNRAEHDPSRDEVKFSPTMHGTQHCVIAMQSSTFELVVSPPTPRADEHEWQYGSAVTGVSITSHKMPHATPPRPPSPSLQPPPFELAPGRAMQIAQRKKLATAQHAKAAASAAAQSAVLQKRRANFHMNQSMPASSTTSATSTLAPTPSFSVTARPQPSFRGPAPDVVSHKMTQRPTNEVARYIPPSRRRMTTVASAIAQRHLVPAAH